MNALRRLRFSLRNQGMGSTLGKARGLVLDEEAKLLREKVDVRFAANPSARVSRPFLFLCTPSHSCREFSVFPVPAAVRLGPPSRRSGEERKELICCP